MKIPGADTAKAASSIKGMGNKSKTDYYVKEVLNQQQKDLEPGVAMNLGGFALCAAPCASGMVKSSGNTDFINNGSTVSIKELFYKPDSLNLGTREQYQKLFKEYPDTMIEFQNQTARLNKSYQKVIKNAPNSGALETELKTINEKVKSCMQKALTATDDKARKAAMDEMAKLTQGLEEANTKLSPGLCGGRKAAKNLKNTMTQDTANYKNNIKTAVENPQGKVKPAVKGAKFRQGFSLKGVGRQAGVTALFTLLPGIISGTYKGDDGKKELKKDVTRTVTTAATWSLTEAGAKWGVKKLVSKLVGKAAGKGIGMAIGGAIGSVIPGLGTIVGIAAGFLVDAALEKWVWPNVFGKGKSETRKQLTKTATNSYQNVQQNTLFHLYGMKNKGKKLDEKSEKLLKINADYLKAHENEYTQFAIDSGYVQPPQQQVSQVAGN